MNTTLSHVIQAVYGTPWFIQPGPLRTIDEVVRLHLAGGRLAPEEIRERLEVAAATAGPRRGGQVVSSVGVIPIYGVIIPRANLLSEFSGGATVQGITRAFRELLEDESVGSILFDIDSPGGQAGGIEELATEIRNARGRKPMVAIANTLCASAGYYLASQADEVIASPSSLVGSIGCIFVHTEFSRMDEQLGITSTIVRRPPAKADANSIEPLTDEAKAGLEERVGDYYGQFVNAVAKARGVTAAQVRAGYGEGRVLTAARAKEAGLVDRVDTFDNTIRRLATGKGPVSRGTTAHVQNLAEAARDMEADGGRLIPAGVGPELQRDVDVIEGGMPFTSVGGGDPAPASTEPAEQPAASEPDSDLELRKLKNRARAR